MRISTTTRLNVAAAGWRLARRPAPGSAQRHRRASTVSEQNAMPRFEIAVVLYMRGCMLCDTIVGARQWIGGADLRETLVEECSMLGAITGGRQSAPARRARSATSASDGRPLG